MINLWKKEDLNLLSEYPKEIVDNLDNVINILDESYGNNRKVTDNAILYRHRDIINHNEVDRLVKNLFGKCE